MVFSVPMFRFRGLYFAIATLVLAQAVYVFMVNWNGLGGTTGLFLTEYTSQITTYPYALRWRSSQRSSSGSCFARASA